MTGGCSSTYFAPPPFFGYVRHSQVVEATCISSVVEVVISTGQGAGGQRVVQSRLLRVEQLGVVGEEVSRAGRVGVSWGW